MKVNGISGVTCHLLSGVDIRVDVPRFRIINEQRVAATYTVADVRNLAAELRFIADQYDLAAERLRAAGPCD